MPQNCGPHHITFEPEAHRLCSTCSSAVTMPKPCSNCGSTTARGPHRLRFSLEGRAPKVLEINLCGACLNEFLEEEGIRRSNEEQAFLN